MKFLLIFIVLPILAITAMILIKKVVERIINLYALSKKESYYNIEKQRNGIVYNKENNKLEADQSIILPFE
ncbi:hypothetical protein [Bacteroides cellulolyticus]|uniref:hypothetical protein n=1 Tax=Bacteroides cellulolyticus TaxID=2981780 RepID=UPI0012AB8914|nr:hypothetical protein [Bacteroides cellulolyticus]MCU6771185.1 hypothetical protein [Bacteroides cellulolyticus]